MTELKDTIDNGESEVQIAKIRFEQRRLNND